MDVRATMNIIAVNEMTIGEVSMKTIIYNNTWRGLIKYI